MKKGQRILAIIGVILLVSLYIITLISAIFTTPYSAALFKSSVYCTIMIPILIYIYMMIYKLLNKDKDAQKK